jgi:polysaccharide transporter, PST family
MVEPPDGPRMRHSFRDRPLGGAALKRVSANGAAISLGSQIARLAIQLAYQVLLARRLSPAEFGLVAMAAPIVAFVRLFADLGLSQATIQREEISQGELSLLFCVNVGASVLLGTLTVALAPLAGAFYGEPKVAAITAAFGGLLLIEGFYTQQLAILNRNMAFARLASTELTAVVAGALAGIAAASRGFGYWSILIGQGATTLTTLVLAWALSGWWPSVPRGGARWRTLVGFGGNVAGFNIVNYLARNFDNVLIGKFIGREALGLYDRAYKLMLLPLTQFSQPLGRVALPLLARTRSDSAAYRASYLRIVEVAVMLTYPFILFAIVTRRPLIAIVLGSRWAGVGPIFALLGLGALYAPISHSVGWLFISQERTRELRNWGSVSSVLFVASFVAGLRWGPIGVAASFVSVIIILQGPLVLWAATRTGPVRMSDVLRMLRPHAFSAVVCCAVEACLIHAVRPDLLILTLLLLVAYGSYAAALLALPGGREVFVVLWRHGRPALTRLGIVRQ